ncbi:MAG: LptF/LptG family permease, partial [Bacteroidales bacterium]|nr:LptF/LptG family permease [Bacteroidales bacterium]
MLRLKKIDSYILKAYVGPLILMLCITTFILLMQFLWKYVDDMVGKGLEWSVILELLFFATMNILQMSLPLSILCASIFVYGNLGESNELIAIKAAGVSLFRLMMPLIIFNVFVAGFGFVYSNNILPYSNLRLWSLMYDVRNQRPEMNIKEGVFFDGIEQVRIKIAHKNPETNMMYDVMIYDHRNNLGNTNVTIADSARMEVINGGRYLQFLLYHGRRYEDVTEGVDAQYMREKNPFRTEEFSKQQALFELESFGFSRTDMDLFRHNSQMQNVSQLRFTIDSLQETYTYRNQRSFDYFFSQYFFKSRSKSYSGGELVNIDTLFAAFNTAYQEQTLTRALSYARSSENYLATAIDNNETQDMTINKHRIELHKKFILALGCFIMFFVGAPFGSIVRKGGLGVPIIFSFFFYLSYYVLSMFGERAVKAVELPAFQGMWISTAVILVLGIYFTYMAV